VLRVAGRWRMRPTRANGQPAVVVHKGTEPYGVQVLDLLGGRIARITAFNDPTLVPTFDGPGRAAPERPGSGARGRAG